MSRLRVIELFAGVGAQRMALRNLGIDHEVVAISEIDKNAIQSYQAIHGPVNNLGDITTINSLPEADLWTYSFPCQDISNAGKNRGFSKTAGTRSGLLWEVERLLNDSPLPRFLLMENVPMILSERYKRDWAQWISALAQLGYTSFYGQLNSKDFGVPQDRERVFMVSTLDNSVFTFPRGKQTTIKLADILVDEVSEKYYISPERTEGLIQSLKEKTISRTIHAGGHDTATNKHNWDWVAVPKLNHIGNVDMGNNDMLNRVYHPNGLCPTVRAHSGGNTEPKIAVREATKAGYAIAEPGDMVDIGYPNSELRRGRVGKGIAHGLTTSPSQTVVVKTSLTEQINQIVGPCRLQKGMGITFHPNGNIRPFKADASSSAIQQAVVTYENNPSACITSASPPKIYRQHDIRIRKLTSRECWRLMGFSDEDYDKAKAAGTSETQLYRQAGNSIVVNVLEAIFDEMLNPASSHKQFTLSNYH